MLPILTKPLLQYGVEEAINAGIFNMSIVTGRGKRAIEDHFDNSFELEFQLAGTSKEHYLNDIKNVINSCSFAYIRQRQMLGLGHAILSAQPLIGKESFAVLLADDLCLTDDSSLLLNMIRLNNQYNCSVIAIEEIPITDSNKYGMISGNLIEDSNDCYEVTDMVEKPEPENAPSNLGIIGRYILTPDIFNILQNTKADKNGEIQITNALKTQAKQGKVIAYKFKGNRFDCGSIEGFLKATNYLAKKQGYI